MADNVEILRFIFDADVSNLSRGFNSIGSDMKRLMGNINQVNKELGKDVFAKSVASLEDGIKKVSSTLKNKLFSEYTKGIDLSKLDEKSIKSIEKRAEKDAEKYTKAYFSSLQKEERKMLSERQAASKKYSSSKSTANQISQEAVYAVKKLQDSMPKEIIENMGLKSAFKSLFQDINNFSSFTSKELNEKWSQVKMQVRLAADETRKQLESVKTKQSESSYRKESAFNLEKMQFKIDALGTKGGDTGLLKQRFEEAFKAYGGNDINKLKDAMTALNREYAVSSEKLKALTEQEKKELQIQKQIRQEYESKRKLLYDLQEVTHTAIYAMTAAFAYFSKSIQEPLQAFGDFEEKVNKFKSISMEPGMDSKQVEALGEAFSSSVQEIARGSKFMSSEVASAGVELTKLGFSGVDTISALKGITTAAEASGEDIQLVAELIGGIRTGFGMVASDAEKISNVLTQSALSSATSYRSLSETFKYIAPIAKASGQDFDDLAGIVSILGNNMILNSQAGTTMRQSMLRLMKQTPETATTLEALNVQVTDDMGNMKKYPQILKDLARALDGMSDSVKGAALTAIYGDRAVTGMMAAINMIQEKGEGAFDKIINEHQFENVIGLTEKMKAVAFQGLNAELAKLRSAFENFNIELGRELAPTFEFIIKLIRESVDVFSNLSDYFQGFIGNTALILTAISAAGLGLSVFTKLLLSAAHGFLFVGEGMKILAVGLNQMKIGLVGLGLSAGAATASLGILFAAIFAISGLLYSLNERLKDEETTRNNLNEIMLIQKSTSQDLASTAARERKGIELTTKELYRQAHAYAEVAREKRKYSKDNLQTELENLKQRKKDMFFAEFQSPSIGTISSKDDIDDAIKILEEKIKSYEKLSERASNLQKEFIGKAQISSIKSQFDKELVEVFNKIISLKQKYDNTKSEVEKLSLEKQLNEEREKYLSKSKQLSDLTGKDALTSDQLKKLEEDRVKIIETTNKTLGKSVEEESKRMKILKQEFELREKILDIEKEQAEFDIYAQELNSLNEILGIKMQIKDIDSQSFLSQIAGNGSFDGKSFDSKGQMWDFVTGGKAVAGGRYHSAGAARGSHDHGYWGKDLPAAMGTPTYSAQAGKVISAGWMGGYGKAIIVEHEKGVQTLYAHLNEILVKEGQQVAKGSVLGKIGSTGHSSGPHLHFEVRINGQQIDHDTAVKLLNMMNTNGISVGTPININTPGQKQFGPQKPPVYGPEKPPVYGPPVPPGWVDKQKLLEEQIKKALSTTLSENSDYVIQAKDLELIANKIIKMAPQTETRATKGSEMMKGKTESASLISDVKVILSTVAAAKKRLASLKEEYTKKAEGMSTDDLKKLEVEYQAEELRLKTQILKGGKDLSKKFEDIKLKSAQRLEKEKEYIEKLQEYNTLLALEAKVKEAESTRREEDDVEAKLNLDLKRLEFERKAKRKEINESIKDEKERTKALKEIDKQFLDKKEQMTAEAEEKIQEILDTRAKKTRQRILELKKTESDINAEFYSTERQKEENQAKNSVESKREELKKKLEDLKDFEKEDGLHLQERARIARMLFKLDLVEKEKLRDIDLKYALIRIQKERELFKERMRLNSAYKESVELSEKLATNNDLFSNTVTSSLEDYLKAINKPKRVGREEIQKVISAGQLEKGSLQKQFSSTEDELMNKAGMPKVQQNMYKYLMTDQQRLDILKKRLAGNTELADKLKEQESILTNISNIDKMILKLSDDQYNNYVDVVNQIEMFREKLGYANQAISMMGKIMSSISGDGFFNDAANGINEFANNVFQSVEGISLAVATGGSAGIDQAAQGIVGVASQALSTMRELDKNSVEFLNKQRDVDIEILNGDADMLEKRNELFKSSGDISDELYNENKLTVAQKRYEAKVLELDKNTAKSMQESNSATELLKAFFSKEYDLMLAKRNAGIQKRHDEQKKLFDDELAQEKKKIEFEDLKSAKERKTSSIQAQIEVAKKKAELSGNVILAYQLEMNANESKINSEKEIAKEELNLYKEGSDQYKELIAKIELLDLQLVDNKKSTAEKIREYNRTMFSLDSEIESAKVQFGTLDEFQKKLEQNRINRNKAINENQDLINSSTGDLKKKYEDKNVTINLEFQQSENDINAEIAKFSQNLQTSIDEAMAAGTEDGADNLKIELTKDLQSYSKDFMDTVKTDSSLLDSALKLLQEKSRQRINQYHIDQLKLDNEKRNVILDSNLEIAKSTSDMYDDINVEADNSKEKLIQEIRIVREKYAEDSDFRIQKEKETAAKLLSIEIQRFNKLSDLRKQELDDYNELLMLKAEATQDYTDDILASYQIDMSQVLFDIDKNNKLLAASPNDKGLLRKAEILEAKKASIQKKYQDNVSDDLINKLDKINSLRQRQYEIETSQLKLDIDGLNRQIDLKQKQIDSINRDKEAAQKDLDKQLKQFDIEDKTLYRNALSAVDLANELRDALEYISNPISNDVFAVSIESALEAMQEKYDLMKSNIEADYATEEITAEDYYKKLIDLEVQRGKFAQYAKAEVEQQNQEELDRLRAQGKSADELRIVQKRQAKETQNINELMAESYKNFQELYREQISASKKEFFDAKDAEIAKAEDEIFNFQQDLVKKQDLMDSYTRSFQDDSDKIQAEINKVKDAQLQWGLSLNDVKNNLVGTLDTVISKYKELGETIKNVTVKLPVVNPDVNTSLPTEFKRPPYSSTKGGEYIVDGGNNIYYKSTSDMLADKALGFAQGRMPFKTPSSRIGGASDYIPALLRNDEVVAPQRGFESMIHKMVYDNYKYRGGGSSTIQNVYNFDIGNVYGVDNLKQEIREVIDDVNKTTGFYNSIYTVTNN